MRRRKKILIVDSDKSVLLGLSHALGCEGVEVITCNRAEWAQKALQNYTFDMMITELRLSETDQYEGFQIVELARKRNALTKIVVITDHGSKEIQDLVKQLGADEYFDKPIDSEDLLATVRQLGIPLQQKAEPSAVLKEDHEKV